jgi:MFS transporter, PAT family, beta-lactamase induction signal transducer AmpG
LRSRYALPAFAAILYFSQGFPFGIVNEGVNLYLSFAKVDLGTVGLVGSVGILWTLKFLWAPAVDAIASYRTWILGALLALAVTIAALGAVPPGSPAFWAILIALVFASATQDIAIDALIIRTTPDNLLGVVNSVRVGAYRVAMLVAGAAIGVLADRLGWPGAFMAVAVLPLLIFAVLGLRKPAEREVLERQENPLRGLLAWLRRPGAFLLVAVILLYRMGDNTMMAMIRPYWAARGFTPTEVAQVTTTLGMICTILGAVAGGWFIARYGIYRSLLVLGIVQMLSNLTYAVVAMTNAGRPAMYGAAIVETFCGGLGTAAFLAFLMFICDKTNAATEYAMLSALFAIGRTFAIAISGYLATDLGFANYYWLTAALALPGLALLPLIRGRLASASATDGAPAH